MIDEEKKMLANAFSRLFERWALGDISNNNIVRLMYMLIDNIKDQEEVEEG